MAQIIIPLACILSFTVCLIGLLTGITANNRTFRKLLRKIKF